jgi:hypothetical protein
MTAEMEKVAELCDLLLPAQKSSSSRRMILDD